MPAAVAAIKVMPGTALSVLLPLVLQIVWKGHRSPAHFHLFVEG